jgi:hypothetical protein
MSKPCYPQPRPTGRGCFPESKDSDGCYPAGPVSSGGSGGSGGSVGSVLRDLLRAVTEPAKRPSPRAARGRSRPTRNI